MMKHHQNSVRDNRMKQNFENSISDVSNEFYKNPLIVLNERDLAFLFHFKLLTKFNNKIPIKCDTISNNLKINKTFFTERVHQEMTTYGIIRRYGKRKKVDILVTKDKGVELYGFNYKKGTPSNIFYDENIEIAIELKFYREVNLKDNNIIEIKLREAQIKSIEEDIKKLETIKSKNEQAITAFIIFSHTPLIFQKSVEDFINKSRVDIKFRTNKNIFWDLKR